MTAPLDRAVRLDELRLYFLDWPGDEQAVICLHGITANAHAFEGIAEELSPAHRVVAMDLRGRGGSDTPPNGYNVGVHVEDVAGLMDRLGIGRAIAIGWSLGAKVALALAATHPSRVERLVLLDPPVETPPQAAETLRAYWQRLDRTYPSMEAFFEQMRGSPALGQWTPYVERFMAADVVEEEHGQVRHRIPRWVPETELGAESAYPTRGFLPKIACPTLVLRSPEPITTPGDQVLTAEEARELATAIRDCRVLEIAGTKHFTIVLGQPRGTLEAIRRFLGERRDRRAG
jgi:pimeloyl-ACP methyl ester carboxylesterase